MKKLMIVESPTKAKHIGTYLGADFEVKYSVGHVRDLPKKGGLSIKITENKKNPGEWTFEPKYEVSPEKKSVVADLRKAAKEASEIYLAPDPDREGEAIAWHLNEVLAKEIAGKKVMRVTYNEVTKAAVTEAVTHPREINAARVDAQQARRILDRLVGFKVSPLLWKYLPYGNYLSAGRVQTVALRLLVEREKEIRAFVPEKYWVMGVEATSEQTKFSAKLARLDGEKPEIKALETADSLVKDLQGAGLLVTKVEEKPKTRHAYPPFTTSTLQQTASSVCGFVPKRTMGLAQRLFENGFITYMRTDSVNISEEARTAAKEFIENEYGKDFLPEKPNFYKSKGDAQAAHEAIRPTDVTRVPWKISGLDAAESKLYDLIWRRFTASQMTEAKLSVRAVTMKADKDGMAHDYTFTTSDTRVLFEGFLKAMPGATAAIRKDKDGDEEAEAMPTLPILAVGDKPEVVKWLADGKETKPPARFSEAALVKALEENGVGRPSTYAQTLDTLVSRRYATRENRQLVPTKVGEGVADWLVKRLTELFDVGYTATMEEKLDKIEEGEETGNKMLSIFYAKFLGWLEGAKDPPPDAGKFKDLFALLDEVKQWHEPRKSGKRTYDDKEFVESVKQQLEEAPEKLSDKQLRALAQTAADYRDQITGCDERMTALGYGDLLERVKSAPPEESVKECVAIIDKSGTEAENRFFNDLKKMAEAGRMLSPKQFAALLKMACEAAGDDEEGKAFLAKHAADVPDGIKAKEPKQDLSGLFEKLDAITEWKEPVKRGRRTYDDKEFMQSVKRQYAAKKQLSYRQVTALKKMAAKYGIKAD